MKYVYILLVLALIGGGYFAYTAYTKDKAMEAAVPEGYHMMPDGTLMRNDQMEQMNMENDASMETMDMDSEMNMEGESQMQSDTTVELDADLSLGLTEAKVFTVTGINHAFDLKEIHVQKGDTVTINFESTDGYHDWVVDEFDAATEKVQPGTPTSVTFVADTAGSFEYYCSVGNHRAQGMVGTLMVME